MFGLLFIGVLIIAGLTFLGGIKLAKRIDKN